MTHDDFTAGYHKFVASIIDEDGVYPTPLHVIDSEDRLTCVMIDNSMSPTEVYRVFWNYASGVDARVKHPKAVIMGLDRTTRPNQGTEFADVLTCVLWWDDPEVNWGNSLKIGVINYQNEPRIVRPWDWDNEFWNREMLAEAKGFRPAFRVKVTSKAESTS